MKHKNPLPLRLVILGHVDHGKSTLIGRLLHDTGSLPHGKKEAIEKSCRKRGQPFEWAFLMDALQAERDQNVTIETTQIWLKQKQRDTVIIDAPGHREFIRNMVTGTAQADAALLVVDAKGLGEQTRGHASLLTLLGIRQVAVLVNKMDAVDYRQAAFQGIERQCRKYLKTLGIAPLCVIPISAREGDNVTRASSRMKWYQGKTVLKVLEAFKVSPPTAGPLRLPVQDVYKSGDKRVLVGRIERGALKVGDTLLFSPANTKARVATLEQWGSKKSPKQAAAGQSIGITLDAPIFVERGALASHEKQMPLLTNLFPARIFWLGKTPLAAGNLCLLKIGTLETPAEIKSIAGGPVAYGGIAEVTLRTRGQVALDEGSRFALLQGNIICGGGVASLSGVFDQRLAGEASVKSKHIAPEHFGITRAARAEKNRHGGGILWLTGLSGAGKSTIARLAQEQLFARGCQVFVLDGDNIRHGLSRDLGFSASDRHENLRRVAEVAALFANAGMIVITAFISPYEKDRELARAVAKGDAHIVYVRASLKICEKRDVKGLYRKARTGKIPQFTGISAPYEEPKNADLVLDSENRSAKACAQALVAYITRHLIETNTWNSGSA